jgi:hypothetical protein
VCQEEFGHKIWGAVSVIITRRNVECFLRPLISCFQEVALKHENRKPSVQLLHLPYCNGKNTVD